MRSSHGTILRGAFPKAGAANLNRYYAIARSVDAVPKKPAAPVVAKPAPAVVSATKTAENSEDDGLLSTFKDVVRQIWTADPSDAVEMAEDMIAPATKVVSEILSDLESADAYEMIDDFSKAARELIFPSAVKYSVSDPRWWIEYLALVGTFPTRIYTPCRNLAQAKHRIPDKCFVLVVGDIGTGDARELAVLSRAREELQKLHADLAEVIVLHLGDVYYYGKADECERHWRV